MKISEFVQDFKEKKIKNTQINENAVAEYITKTLEVKGYLPFAEKRELCKRVLDSCNTVDRTTGLVKVDSVRRYIIFTITILSKYTNLEFSAGQDDIDSLDEYDMLCQNGLLNPILEVIGEEYEACNNMLNMMMSDVMTNHNTVENVLGNAAARLMEIVDDVAWSLTTKIDELNLDLNQVDIDKYKGLLEMLTHK